MKDGVRLISGAYLKDVADIYLQESGPAKETRFTSTKPAKEIVSTIEEAAKPLGFNVQKRDYKMKLQGDKHGRKGHLSVATEVGCLLMMRSICTFLKKRWLSCWSNIMRLLVFACL
jgi:hypothetical protein